MTLPRVLFGAVLLGAVSSGQVASPANGAGPAEAFQARLDVAPGIQVNLATGNLHLCVVTSRFARGERTPRHEVALYHNSRAVQSGGDQSGLGLGNGWSSAFGGGVSFPTATRARLVMPDGRQRDLDATGPGTWRSEIETEIDLATAGAGWIATDARQWTWHYDSAGLLVQIRDASCNTYTITRQSGLVTSATDPNGRYATFHVDTAGRLQDITDSLGNVWSFTHDPEGRVATVADPSYGSAAFTYDARDRIQTLTDNGGSTWQFVYHDAGPLLDHVWKVIDPRDRTLVFGYVVSTDKLTQMTDLTGNVWSARHDRLDPPALLSFVRPSGHTWKYAPDARRRIEHVTSPSLRTWTFEYDDSGNLLAHTDPLDQKRTWTYDAFNNPTSTTYGGQTVAYHYEDPLHPTALTRHVEPLATGQSATTSYLWYGPQEGTPTGVWNGLLASITDPTGALTRFEYDAEGAYVALHEGPPTAAGRVERRWDTPGDPHFLDHGVMPPAPGVPGLPTPPAALGGRLALDGTGTRTWFGAEAGQVWQLGVPLGLGAAESSTLTRTAVQDEFGRALGLDITTDEPFEQSPAPEPSATTLAFSATHDDVGAGRPSTIHVPGGPDLVLEYADDQRLSRISTPGVTPGLGSVLAYDDDGQLESVTRKDGTSTIWTRTDNDLVDTIVHRNSAAIVLALDYDYDGRDLPVQLTETSATQTVVTTWINDAAGRLLRESRSVNGGPAQEQRFTYDAAGNRRTCARYSGAQLLTTDAYVYDFDAPAVHGTHNNRLVSVQRRAGNRALLSTLYLLYDNPFGHVSRLVREVVGSSTVTATVFEYADDGSPWLVWDESWTDAESGPTDLVRSPVLETRQIAGAGRLWRRLDGQSFLPVGPATWRFELGPAAAEFHVSEVDGAVTFVALETGGDRVLADGRVAHELPDLVGSARLCEMDGAFTGQAFTAWGERLSGPATLPDGGFCGSIGVRQAFDGVPLSSSGILAMGHRWYMPELGRFLMRDPIGAHGGINVYAYGGNLPTLRVDPLGLAPHGGQYWPPTEIRRRRKADPPPGFPDPPPDYPQPGDPDFIEPIWPRRSQPRLPQPGDPGFIGPIWEPAPQA